MMLVRLLPFNSIVDRLTALENMKMVEQEFFQFYSRSTHSITGGCCCNPVAFNSIVDRRPLDIDINLGIMIFQFYSRSTQCYWQ